jgi:hypothetical protein
MKGLGSISTCAFSEAGFSSQNGDHVWGVYYQRAAFGCAFLFVGKLIFTKTCFVFTVGSVCRVKLFTTGSRNSLKDVRNPQMLPHRVRKWLRQQSKDFYVARFDAPLKRWDMCTNVGGGGGREINIFPRFEYHMYYILYPFATYLLTVSHS